MKCKTTLLFFAGVLCAMNGSGNGNAVSHHTASDGKSCSGGEIYYYAKDPDATVGCQSYGNCDNVGTSYSASSNPTFRKVNISNGTKDQITVYLREKGCNIATIRVASHSWGSFTWDSRYITPDGIGLRDLPNVHFSYESEKPEQCYNGEQKSPNAYYTYGIFPNRYSCS